jgi:hypothetical protein
MVGIIDTWKLADSHDTHQLPAWKLDSYRLPTANGSLTRQYDLNVFNFPFCRFALNVGVCAAAKNFDARRPGELTASPLVAGDQQFIPDGFLNI